MARVKGVKAARGRSKSCGSLEEIWKRKREEQGEGGREEEEIFRSNKKTVRSSDMDVKGLGGGVEGMVRRLMREELGKVMKEIREVKSWREEVKGWREDMRGKIRGGLREQGKWLRKELEGMRKELREREVEGGEGEDRG